MGFLNMFDDEEEGCGVIPTNSPFHVLWEKVKKKKEKAKK